ncbi:MAG: hypothetical protein Fur0012_08640 [Elusimicrobiota bacterium]
MKVIFAPDYGDNDYQPSLKAALASLGIEVFPAYRRLLFPISGPCFRIGPQVLHLHWLGPYLFSSNWLFSIVKFLLFIAELFLCRLKGVRIVWTVHDIYNHEGYQKKLEIFFNRIIILFADSLIVHSQGQKAALSLFYGVSAGNKTVVALEGGYNHIYSRGISSAEARSRLSVSSDKKVFLFYGNIRPYKGLDVLIDAFIIDPEDKVLLIAGKCIDRITEERIKGKIGGFTNVVFYPGYATAEKTALLFSAADAVILPYLAIFNSGLIPLCLSMGKPVIYSDLELLKEQLEGCGISFKAGDAAALARAMREISIEDIHGFSVESRRRGGLRSWEKHAEILLSVYGKNSKK